MMKIEKKDIIKELQREIGMRQKFYPKWTQSGKIHQAVAERRLLCLQEVLEMVQGEKIIVNRQKSLFP